RSRGGPRLLLSSAEARARTSWVRGSSGAGAVLLGFSPSACAGALAWRYAHAGASGFGQTDRDRLFRVLCTVLAFTDVVYLFAHELAGRGRLGLTACEILRGLSLRCLIRHTSNTASSMRGQAAQIAPH